MPNNDSLGNRMKTYESVSKTYLTRRIPAIIRIDGKAFHTFTRGMKKPFDCLLMSVMQLTMKALCEEVQGCVLGYTQSDEITLVLTDYETITTDAWFGYCVQKMASIAASIATIRFNAFFAQEVSGRIEDYPDDDKMDASEWNYLMKMYEKNFHALFDARAFSIPKDEVCNCLIWRQQDATRNSIEAVGQANFSQRQLNGKSCNEIQDMLFKEKGINWNDFPVDCKRGACCVKVLQREEIADPHHTGETVVVERRRWVIDKEPPIFTQNRDYVEKLL